MLDTQSAELEAWSIAHAAARAVGAFDLSKPARFALLEDGELALVGDEGGGRNGHGEGAESDDAVLRWNPDAGWEPLLDVDHPQRDLLELYLPISGASAARPITVGHLGQSLDGFIATSSGDSCSVTGPENILHLHRLRALCDAVIVGAGTVEADNPRLTTRLVDGANPVRVIIDPACRLPAAHAVFSDREASTLRASIAGSPAADAARARGEDVLAVRALGGTLDLADLLRQLHERGCHRIFVEGGGVTVSAFLEAGLLDRLHIAVAPLLIGAGRPTIRISPRLRLRDCLRLQHRVYRAGRDILFDCDLRAAPQAQSVAAAHGPDGTVQRVL